MDTTAPSSAEIEVVRGAIGSSAFPRLVHFSDVVNRYLSIRYKDKVDWLRASVLVFLIMQGGISKPSSLARLLLRSNYGMTKLIDGLEKDGLVVRDRGGSDRRTVDVKVTSEGLAYILQVLELAKLCESEAFSALDQGEIKTFGALVRKVRNALIEQTANELANDD